MLHVMWDLSSPNRDQTLHWKCRVLTTGLPGRSLNLFLTAAFYRIEYIFLLFFIIVGSSLLRAGFLELP